jgi:hypothetical protein
MGAPEGSRDGSQLVDRRPRGEHGAIGIHQRVPRSAGRRRRQCDPLVQVPPDHRTKIDNLDQPDRQRGRRLVDGMRTEIPLHNHPHDGEHGEQWEHAGESVVYG